MKAGLCGVPTYFLSFASPFSAVSLELGVLYTPVIGAGLLMKAAFNLVKCCRDEVFDICIDGIGKQRWTGLIMSGVLFAIHRGHSVQKDRAASRELM